MVLCAFSVVLCVIKKVPWLVLALGGDKKVTQTCLSADRVTQRFKNLLESGNRKKLCGPLCLLCGSLCNKKIYQRYTQVSQRYTEASQRCTEKKLCAFSVALYVIKKFPE